jgi:hypothetical protein
MPSLRQIREEHEQCVAAAQKLRTDYPSLETLAVVRARLDYVNVRWKEGASRFALPENVDSIPISQFDSSGRGVSNPK